MEIKFQDLQSADEAIESLVSIFRLFEDQYGINCFKDMLLQVTLLDAEQEEVEIVDAASSAVIDIFEVRRAPPTNEEGPQLTLVVDNTVH